MKLFAIFDRLAGTFGEPFPALKEELAIRRFDYIMQNSPMVAQDCDLYLLGGYDTDTGCISPLEKPSFIYRFGGANGSAV